MIMFCGSVGSAESIVDFLSGIVGICCGAKV
jgi:hypothetical protein